MLDNKVVIITGASGGLGSVVTKAFLDAGARVAGVDRSAHSNNAAHPNLTHFAVALDNAGAVDMLVRDVVNLYGKIDAVVHLVGGFAGGQRADETSDETWENMIAINLRPAWVLSRAVLPMMREARRGAFIAIGSAAALEPAPMLGAYGASKAALISLVRTIAAESKEFGVRANIVSPNTMDTPANRSAMPDVDPAVWVQPANVASLLAWLVSDAGAEVSGAVIPLPGRGA
ncbi:MAG: SDR family NAD(P)-dependent oxidoreductase [Acidobacteria bacterium]|nr:SDR family NAD(P)-dependent oxidoreductase [Acidobacteriota bacterium]